MPLMSAVETLAQNGQAVVDRLVRDAGGDLSCLEFLEFSVVIFVQAHCT